MKKLRLDVDDVLVESFSVSEQEEARGTVRGHQTNIDDLCTADCTGIGVECFTANPAFYACSAVPCSGPPACTHGTCQTYWPEEETC